MNKLRLLLFDDCNRNCHGCCNKDWDLKGLEKEDSFIAYDKIFLTGGEPMLKPGLIIEVVNKIRCGSGADIYLYTAKIDNFGMIITILQHIDGLTVTLHEQADVENFALLCEKFNYLPMNKSLRLNVFKGIKLPEDIDLHMWKVKSDIEWIKNCPLPKNEVFKRYK